MIKLNLKAEIIMASTDNMEDMFFQSDDSLLQDAAELSEETPSEIGSCDSSYTSETPLIGDNVTDSRENVTCNDENVHCETNSIFIDSQSDSRLGDNSGDNQMEGHMDSCYGNNKMDSHMDCSYGNKKMDNGMDRLSLSQSIFSRQTSVDPSHSVLDIADCTEQVPFRPLNIIGTGWECGSISSICHLAASKDGFRSRLGTMEKQSNIGSIDFLPQNRLLSRVFNNSISSFQFSKKGSIISDLHKSIILDKGEIEEEVLDVKIEEVRPKNFKNLCIASIGLTLLYFAIGGLRNLQSSLNAESGVLSLAAVCTTFTLGSLISPFIVQMYRPKLCIILGFTSHIFYIFANYWPRMEYLVPSSLIMGLANALTWNAVCTYITELGINEAYHKNQFVSHILSRYFGLFFLTQQVSTVIGNLISSLILIPKTPKPLVSDDVFNNTSSAADLINNSFSSVSSSICGVGFSNMNANESAVLAVDEFDKLFLLGTYATCVVIAVLTIVIFLDHLPNYSSKSSSVCEVLVQAKDVISMIVDRKFFFVIVLCLYTVVGNGFVIADTLRAYVTCPLGIYMVGYTMICFGVCGSISAMIFGRLQQYIGRVPIFLLATLINVVSLVLMVTWLPTADDVNLIFVLLGAWGFADGIWQSQTISLISSVFEDRYETALGCCRFLQGIAGIVVFLLSDLLDMHTKIIVVTGTCLLAFILYMVMEVMLKCEKRRENVTVDGQGKDVTVEL